MRQKFAFKIAMAACLSLALVPAFASERTVDRHGDRTKAGKGTSANGGVTIDYSTHRLATFSNSKGNASATTNRAAVILKAAKKADRDTAIQMLDMVTAMNLETSVQNDAILSTTYEMLAGLYEGPSRQVMMLGMALQFASDAGRRSDLERQITSLGGDVFTVTFNTAGLNSYARRDPGADDSCLGGPVVALPHSETMSITPAGDHNWRSFDLLGTVEDGHFARIETISDMPGSGTDDTDLTLYDNCPENGGNIIAFNQDIAGDFTSRIDTGCLGPGTYSVEVGGFFDKATPDNFDLEIEIVGTCSIPQVDSFEPDNTLADASNIGLPTPTSGNGWGRAHKEIQAHNTHPPGDRDHAKFSLSKTSLVRMGTRQFYPTFFNGFAQPNPFAIVSHIELFYENEPDYGGRCNQSTLDFQPPCRVNTDCPVPLEAPVPGLPACIPLRLFGVVDEINPIAANDFRSGSDFGSELLTCLPRSGSDSPSLQLQATGGGFAVQVSNWVSPTTGNMFDPFDYEVQVKNEVGCLYEQEPNDNFRTSVNPYAIGQTVSAFADFGAAYPFIDRDVYLIPVEETTEFVFETLALDPDVSDTTMFVVVGPSDSGGFFTVGVSDDDGGTGRLSRIQVTLPPATAFLGNTVLEANWLMFVEAFDGQANFDYQFTSKIFTPRVPETEPNDTEADANPVLVTDTVLATLDPSCDIDTFTFTLSEATFVTLETLNGLDGVPQDTTIQVLDCAGNRPINGCDEDSGGPGYLSFLDGCLPAGTWCVQVRPWNDSTIGEYQLELGGTAGCAPDDPPMMNGSETAGRCDTFYSCPDGG